MNFYLTKNTSRAGWQLKKLSVNLKQVCVPLMIAEDKTLAENFPPHISFNSWFSIRSRVLSTLLPGAIGVVGCVFNFLLTRHWPGTTLTVF